MKAITILGMLFLGCSNTFGQTINYDINFDDPEHKFHIKAGLFGDIDWFRFKNYRSGLYFGGAYNLGTRLSFNADVKLGLKRWNKPTKIAINTLDNTHKDISGRATLNFSYRHQKESTKVVLKSTSNSRTSGNTVYTTTNTKSINVMADMIKVYGLTGSVGYYQNQIFQESRGLFSFEDSTQSAQDMTINYGGAYISAGISVKEYQNFEIDATNAETGEKYLGKGSKFHSNVIIEAVYMPGVFMSKEFVVPNVGTQTLASKPDIRNLGVRLISDYHSLGTFDYGARFELGTRPGLFVPVTKKPESRAGNWYLTLAFYFVLNK